jgi:hypothetical protein
MFNLQEAWHSPNTWHRCLDGTISLVLCVCFVDRCLSFCTFSFSHCVVCSSSIYGLWLPLWYLQTLLKSVSVLFLYTDSDIVHFCVLLFSFMATCFLWCNIYISDWMSERLLWESLRFNFKVIIQSRSNASPDWSILISTQNVTNTWRAMNLR